MKLLNACPLCTTTHTNTHLHTPSCLHEDGYQWQPLFSLASSPFLLWFPNHIQQGSPVPSSHTQKAEPCLNPAALINLTDFVNYLFGWLTACVSVCVCVRENVPLWSIWDVCHGWNNPTGPALITPSEGGGFPLLSLSAEGNEKNSEGFVLRFV